MNKIIYTGLILMLALAIIPVTVNADDDEIIYGRQLMTEQELQQHREKMRSFETEQERETYRKEHHKLMQERAKERGVTIPDEPGMRGKGKRMGPRDGYGPGSGSGGGMGPGGGRR